MSVNMEISTLTVMAWKGKKVGACNLKCPYCISHMTHRIEPEGRSMIQPERIAFLADKYKRVCAGIPYGIISSKGETTLTEKEELGKIIEVLYESGLVPELQTNGTLLNPEKMGYWHGKGLNTIALSCVSHIDEVNSQIMSGGKIHWQLAPTIREARKIGLLVRLTAILTKGGIDSPDSLMAFMTWAMKAGAHQLTFRKMGEPRNLALPGSLRVAQWIRANQVDPNFAITMLREKGREKEPLPWALRFGYEGMSVVLTDHMNAPIKEHVRHAVIQPDGHLYGSWDDPSDIII